MQAGSSKINVETNTARVSFCKPHSNAIHFCWAIPDSNFLAIKKVTYFFKNLVNITHMNF